MQLTTRIGRHLGSSARAALIILAALACTSEARAQWATNGNNINNTNSGNVGVGTTTPSSKLTVQNAATEPREVFSLFRPAASNTSAGRSTVAIEFKGDAYSDNPNLFGWTLQPKFTMAEIAVTPKSYSEIGSVVAGGHASMGFLVRSEGHGGLAERMSILGNGNVGIGTTDPTTKLHLMSGTDTATSLLTLDTGVHGGTRMIVGGTSNNESTLDLSVYRAGVYTSRFGVGSAGHVYLQPGATGNVGIGMTAPAYKLDVNGEINATGLRINGTPLSTGGANQWTTSGASVYYNTGNVGVGTIAPAAPLEVDNVSFAGSPNLFSMKDSTTGVASNFYFTIARGPGAFAPGASAGDLVLRSPTTTRSFAITTNNGGSTQLYIRYDGNVGIGTTTPTAKLDVAGNLNASGTITGGTINAKYQDVAEWVPSSQRLQAGTVVVLDTGLSNHVLASSSAYDTKVAGVISAQPGISLGAGGEGKVLVATTGRVKVRVDATNAPIQVGDLLVTSDIEGVAMKSEPIVVGGRKLHAPGTIVGKALEPLASGTGEILVLLSLQ